MGKKSLIKSTSKKTAEKDADEKKKKAAAAKKTTKSAPSKTKKAAAKKAAPKAAAKTKAAPKPKKTAKPKATAKTPPKAKAAAKPKKAAPKKKAAKKKTLSVKELLFQKFDSWAPKSVFSPPKDESAGRDFTPPPMISADSPDEEKRIRALLFLTFDEASLKSAAEEAKGKKAAAEKAAAEKAAAEKAAAEKVAAEKAEPEPEVSVSYPPPPQAAEPADPMEKAIKYGIAGFVALMVILIGASFSNKGNYYLNSANGGLKIYQGRFAPMGKELMMTLPGVTVPGELEEVYSRSQVYPLIYTYYLDKADALLAAQGLPDYQGIRRYLNEALQYAPTNEERRAVYERLDGIELMALLYRADIAARKGTIDSLEESLDYLNKAAVLEIDASQAELIDQKRESVRARIEQLREEAASAEAESAPPPKE